VSEGADTGRVNDGPDSRRVAIILLTAMVALYLYLDWGRPRAFMALWQQHFVDAPLRGLQPFLYSSACSVLFRLALPAAVILFVLRERLSDFGFTPKLGRRYVAIYAGILAFMLPLVWVGAGMDSFQAKYPFYPGAGRSWRLFLIYEFRYLLIFVSGEAFWRGFLAVGLSRSVGMHALSISMVPYVMIHWTKPVPETIGALITAYVLGYLAVRHRTIWLGVAIHFGVAFFMDFFVLLRTGGLPTVW
jgi:hypothetical protein